MLCHNSKDSRKLSISKYWSQYYGKPYGICVYKVTLGQIFLPTFAFATANYHFINILRLGGYTVEPQFQ